MKTFKSKRIFSLLLRLLPFDFQREYASDMEATFREQQKEALRRRQRMASPKLWWRTLGGILATAPREHIDILRKDFRHAARTLARNPGFAFVTILMLALAIGANTAVFSVVDALLLQPLPYQDPEKLMMLWTDIPGEGAHEETTSYANYRDWQDRNRVFSSLGVFDPTSATLAGQTAGDDPEQLMVARVSQSFFTVLGVPAAIGRTFSHEEEESRARVVVLSHAIWQRRFGGSAAVIGRTVLLNGIPSEVIGVMPADFRFPVEETHGWEPLTLFPDWDQRKMVRGTDSWRVIGRLKSGVGATDAQRDMHRVAGELATEDRRNAGLDARVVPLHIQITGRDLRLALWVLMSAVGFVLLIACSNVANMLLALAAARRHELAVRSSLGASRWSLTRQLAAESVLLAGAAAAGGLVIAQSGLSAILSLAPYRVTRLADVRIDGGAIAFTILVSLSPSLLFGIIPGLRAGRVDARSALNSGARHVQSLSRGEKRTHGLLVVFQFAISVILLCGTGMLVRSLMELRTVDLGFEYDRVITTGLTLPPAAGDEQRTLFFGQVLEAIRAVPGVEKASLIEEQFISSNPNSILAIEGNDSLAEVLHQISRESVDSQYFQTMRVPILSGSSFSGQEEPDTPPSAVINDAMARRFWPGQNPVGRRFKLAPRSSNSPWITVVGVAGNMRRQELERDPIPQVFTAFSQNTSRGANLVIRTAGDPLMSAESIRAAIRPVAGTIPVPPMVPLGDRLNDRLRQPRFQTALFSVFSLVALMLTALGTYGLMSYAAAQRSSEVGIRMALGATRAGVLAMMLRQGLRLAVSGIACGLAGALFLSRLFAGLLYGVTAHDPLTFVAAPVVLLGVGALASYFPARRAALIDPVAALR